MKAEMSSVVRDCYQCQKCSAGCPVSFFMDYKPHRIIQMVNLGQIAPLLASNAIWVCAACYTCSTRCPNEVDVAGVIDGLRQRALTEGAAGAEEKIRAFHRAFLDDIRAYGRVHELSMMLRYKMATRTYLDEMRLGWRMFAKGKLKLLPSFVKGRKEIDTMMRRSERVKNEDAIKR